MLVEKYPITLAASNDLLVRRSGYFTTYKRASPEKDKEMVGKVMKYTIVS